MGTSQSDEISKLNEKLKEMEVEKNNLEYTLSRRQDDYIALNESLLSVKSELEEKRKEFDELSTSYQKLQSESSSLRNQVDNLFLQLTTFLSSPDDQLTEKREQITQTVQSLSSADSKESPVPSFVDRVLLLRDSEMNSRATLASHQELLSSQEAHIRQLEEESEGYKTKIDKLRNQIHSLENATENGEELDSQIEELEETNESLRQALRGAKTNMEQQIMKQHETENQLVKLQSELVKLQETSNEMIQQTLAASEAKTSELSQRVARAEDLLAKKEEELETLQATWEKNMGQYEQELAVLRARKVAVEQQVTVSEKFLEDHNRLHREEIDKLQKSLQAAQEEVQELRCQVLEREAELEAYQQSGEETKEQLAGQVASLTEQLRAMQGKLSNQQSSVLSVKKREAELEKEMKTRLENSIAEMEQKDREIIRQQQKGYEEEVGV